MLWVKKSSIIWKGHANIEKHKSLLKKYAININIIAIMMLCEKSYRLKTQDGISESSGFPNFILVGLIIILNK